MSPFNSTDEFLKNKYFLTQQQEGIKKQIIDRPGNNNKANFFAVIGGAGTGKTLLTYDIAKTMISDGKKVLLIHCGQLNDGHNKLNAIQNWEIIPIKHYSNYDLGAYGLVIVDEAQRLYSGQLDDIKQKILQMNGNCIFSYDKLQTLSAQEEVRNTGQAINSIPSINQYKLSEKV